MGFFDSLKQGLQKRVAAQQKSIEKRQSATAPGRMKETDKIKGSDAKIPTKPGIYRHKNKDDGKTTYIGQTDNLRKRQQEHERNGKLDTSKQIVAYKEAKPTANKDLLLKKEKEHIKRHKPDGNSTEGGNGRR